MAEAEDVITDTARFAFDYVQRVRERKRLNGGEPAHSLKRAAQRLDLLAAAAFGRSFPIHAAQAPLPRTLLERLLQRGQAPASGGPVPATDGHTIWLPSLAHLEPDAAFERYRALVMLQAMRAHRGAPAFATRPGPAGALFHVCEAWASEAMLLRRFPGLRHELAAIRAEALAARPDPARLHGTVAGIEQAAQRALRGHPPIVAMSTELEALSCEALYRQAECEARLHAPCRGELLQKDLWLGEFRKVDAAPAPLPAGPSCQPVTNSRPRSARLARRPDVRPAREGEDEQAVPGAFILQTAQPQEKAEDPLGLQRPSDRDHSTPAGDFGDALSELPEARLVSTPGAPAEVLVSDEPISGTNAGQAARNCGRQALLLHYPEWDYRSQDYASAGCTVYSMQAEAGDAAVAESILRKHAATLDAVCRGFQLLRSRRVRKRHQLDGDAIDIDAWVDAECEWRAGGAPAGHVFETQRQERRDLAVLILVDVSGSTDSWISGQRRVIDVEREALLLVSHALDALGEPFSIQAFSGESRDGVVVREIKAFNESFGQPVSLRIAGIEPDRYTRTGSALRHATACLAAEPARHRLLLLLTDGKPNDVDLYEGKYGLHDTRQAIIEARQTGISPICLAIDHQAPHYLGQVFGKHQFAILPRTELLPGVLLAWLRKMLA
ncbi:nitric oxide reductase activation protein NorD [Pseudoduganella sp. S-14]|uniref:nitric oxide reductase activation protein NorD n=1 Tax=Pseudoduganella sp. S-14 TaxID=3404065 RepID=UPI003CE9B944